MSDDFRRFELFTSGVLRAGRPRRGEALPKGRITPELVESFLMKEARRQFAEELEGLLRAKVALGIWQVQRQRELAFDQYVGGEARW